jgi:uroporphyrinogen III methyltransferase / synthase
MGPGEMTASTRPPAPSTTAGRVAFVGSGPGDPGLLTVRARDSLTAATLVVADRGVPAPVLALLGDDVEVRPVGAVEDAVAPGPSSDAVVAPSFRVDDPEAGAGDPLPTDPAELAAVLVAEARAGASVVRLVVGDPLEDAGVVAETRAVAADGVPFDVVPGMPATTAVPTYTGIVLGAAHTTLDVTGAGSGTGPGATIDFSGLGTAPGPLVLAAEPGDLAAVSASLVENGWKPETPALITANGTQSRQRSVDSSLGALAADGADLDSRLVVTVGDAAGERAPLSWWESRALYGWRVLVPRTKDQAGAMSDRLRVHGAVPEEVPTIAVEPPRSPAQMERAVKGLVDGRYQWVVFTSANAVRAVWEKFAEFGLDARAFSGVKIACVGQATADAIRAFGVHPELVPAEQTEQSSEGLLDIFPPHDDVLDPVDRVLLPRADIATETLAEGLQQRGWEIDDVTAYRTVRAAPPPAPVREAIKTGGFDAVCFTSSSTVRNLVGIAGKPHARTIVACIGPKTAETAVEFGLRVDVKPDVAEVPALVEALAAHAAKLRAEGALPPPRKTKARKRT